MSKQIHVYLDKELARRLERLAKRNRRSLTAEVTVLVTERLEQLKAQEAA